MWPAAAEGHLRSLRKTSFSNPQVCLHKYLTVWSCPCSYAAVRYVCVCVCVSLLDERQEKLISETQMCHGGNRCKHVRRARTGEW